jgi:hypothetical protein
VPQQVPPTQNVDAQVEPFAQPWPFFDLQAPDASQVLTPVQVFTPLGSSALVMAVQAPLPAAHAWQAKHDAVMQHTLSTHCPFRHWLLPAQAPPSAFFMTQLVPAQ